MEAGTLGGVRQTTEPWEVREEPQTFAAIGGYPMGTWGQDTFHLDFQEQIGGSVPRLQLRSCATSLRLLPPQGNLPLRSFRQARPQPVQGGGQQGTNYSHAPWNGFLVNNGLNTRRWSHKIKMEVKIPVT